MYIHIRDPKVMPNGVCTIRHVPGEVCFRCKASRGNADFSMCYTNVGPNAAWRATVDVEPPFAERPILCDIIGESLKAVQLDLLHLWNLGVLRDLLGTIIKLLCRRRGVYTGTTIRKRLVSFNKDLRAWASSSKLPLTGKRIKRDTLTWKSDKCPTLKLKAADCGTILQFCNHKLQQVGCDEYPGLVGCTWTANLFSGCLSHAGMFMTNQERETALIAGRFFIHTYLLLANAALAADQLLFKVRPKLHYLLHLLERLQTSYRNPHFGATWMDEDWVRYAIGLKKKMSHRTSSHNILKRFLVLTKSSLDQTLR